MENISYKQEVLRKSVHLSSLWMAAVMFFWPPRLNAGIFAFLLAANIILEYGFYKKWSVCTKTYGKLFGGMLRSKEKTDKFSLSGSPYVLASALMCVVLFTPPVAVVSFASMLIGDTAAALIGRKIGRHKINGGRKSVEGALAFLVSCLLLLLFLTPLLELDKTIILWGVLGIVIAMFAEIYEKQLHLDDNFSIPLIIGSCLTGGLYVF